MSTAYPPDQAQDFIEANGDLKIVGGPIAVGGWFGGSVATLDDYVEKRFPPYGVIVRPELNQVLVWFDQYGSLHVIDVTGEAIAKEVPKAPFESPDSSYLEAMYNRIQELAETARRNLPSPNQALTGIVTVAVALAVIQVAGVFKNRK